MYFKQITVPGLGCNSYVIGCPGARQAVVADPKRDVQDYMDISRDEGMKITHIIETHVHADHVSGKRAVCSYTPDTSLEPLTLPSQTAFYECIKP